MCMHGHFQSFAASSMSSTPPPFCRLLLLFLLVAVASSSTATADRGTYIVFTSPSHMPPEFRRPQDWYASAIASVAADDSSSFFSSPPPSSLNVGSSRITHRYHSAFHGFAASLTSAEARSLELAPGFLAVIPDRLYSTLTTYTPRYMGLVKGSNASGGGNLWSRVAYGDGVIVGVLDTGVWPESRSFSDEGLGPVPEHWRGGCVDAPGFNSSLCCNRKLIGAKFYRSNASGDGEGGSASGNYNGTVVTTTEEKSSPRDTEGHGTHTASTIVGSFVKGASFMGYAAGTASGIAPRARLAAYKVCWESLGGCRSSDILSAMDDSIRDGVDVLSISLGDSEPVPFFRDPVAIAAFFATCYHRILVVCSAGNSGPSPASVINGAPWILTVAASAVDRDYPASIELHNKNSNGTNYNTSFFVGQSLYSSRGSHHSESNDPPQKAPLVFLPSGCDGGGHQSSLNAQNVTGAIVVCRPGATDKGVGSSAVAAAGAAGEVLVQRDALRRTVLPTSFLLPGMVLSAAEGASLTKSAGGGKTRATMTFNGTRFGAVAAPAAASFSARGPNAMAGEVLKPDLMAPGVGILAAWSGDAPPSRDPRDHRRSDYNIISGTSMSCPHAAGVVALLRALHPRWSMASIKSAMMTTAKITDGGGQRPISDEGSADYGEATPWSFGAGEIDANAAADPGLVYNISAEGYMNFLCSDNLGYPRQYLRVFGEGRSWHCDAAGNGGGATDLNYPAISVLLNGSSNGEAADDSCSGQRVTVGRRLENVDGGGKPSVYAVNVKEPVGVTVEVTPTELSFSGSLAEELAFQVTVYATCQNLSRQDGSFGWLTWKEVAGGDHTVRSPLVVIWVNEIL